VPLDLRPEALWVLGPATFEIEQIIETGHHEHGNLESQAQATVSDDRTKTIDIYLEQQEKSS
jgi:hypothetical protein